MKYSVIVFDTAPTGHTLRFLSFPAVLEKALGKLSTLSGRFGPMMQQFGSMMGVNTNTDEMFGKLEDMRGVITEVNNQFKDPVRAGFFFIFTSAFLTWVRPDLLFNYTSSAFKFGWPQDLTTFICVCISEFLSLYETERLVQELTSYEIDTHCIVVNQLLFPKSNSDCDQCNTRYKMRQFDSDHIVRQYRWLSHICGAVCRTKISPRNPWPIYRRLPYCQDAATDRGGARNRKDQKVRLQMMVSRPLPQKLILRL